MKKLTAFIALFILIGCVFTAGCVDTEAEESISPDPIVYTVPADGGVDCILVPVGSVIDISAPTNPSTGYFWEAEIADGLHLDFERYISSDVDDEQFGGAGNYIWTVTADEPGIYSFFAEYKRSGEADARTDFNLLVGVGDAVFDLEGGEAAVSVKKGETVMVIAEGNPTTGYKWTAGELPKGLKIAEEYHPSPSLPALANPDEHTSLRLGSPGFHVWEITAEKAGEYVFAAEYKRVGGDAISTITVNIKAE